MKKIITYDLCLKATHSDLFYREIASFTDQWFSKLSPAQEQLAERINAWRKDNKTQSHSTQTTILELLSLGIILTEHADQIMNFPGWAYARLCRLVSLQEQHPAMEWWIKPLRGVILQLAYSLPLRKKSHLSHLYSLINWLVALGEVTLAERFREIRDCARSFGLEQFIFDQCVALADDFKPASLSALGKYTQRVEEFLDSETRKKQWRYDARLLSSTRAEYHLGMVATQVLNREFRSQFLATGKKVVILPPCMRAKPEPDCKAEMTRLGAHCMSCTIGCRIHQVTCLGRKHGFDVFMIPDQIRVLGAEDQGADRIGVVGVSCVLTNWTGGWDAERMGLPVQGLLLDYVGCQYHWDDVGFPTDLNFKKLMEILEIGA